MKRIWCRIAGVLILALFARPAVAAAPISLDVRDLDIYDTVRLLSTQAAVNVVVDSSVAHRPVTIRLQNVTFDQALATIAQANDLEAVRVGNVTYLGTTETMNRRYPTGTATGTRSSVFALHNAVPDDAARSLTDALPKGTIVVPDRRTSSLLVSGSAVALDRARALIVALDQTSALASVVVPMRFIKASDGLKALQGALTIAAPQAAYALDQQNQIVLTGSNDFVDQAQNIVAKIDRPGQQVRYEVRVTDLLPQETSDIGFTFGAANGVTPSDYSVVTSFLSNSLVLNARLNAMVQNHEARILARPSISTLNNVAASLLVGQQYPIVYFDARTGTQQVQFVNVGVNLNVTPTIGTDGAITTDLETDYSTAVLGQGNYPLISTRKATSTLRVHDGETIVIAGLFSDISDETLTKVPFLGDLPFLGEIFKRRQKNKQHDEVVFLITPHLVADGDPRNALAPLAGRTP